MTDSINPNPIHPITIDLNALPPSTRLQLEQLLTMTTPTTTATASPIHNQDNTTNNPATITQTTNTNQPSDMSYATAARKPPSNNPPTTAAPKTIPFDYPSDIDNDSDDDSVNLYTLVQHKTKGKSTKNSTPITTNNNNHLRDGISGVLAASASIWNEHESANIIAKESKHLDTIRITEGRCYSIYDVTRPCIWIKFHFPTDLPSMTVAPNILQHETIITHIIALLELQFPVDRIYIGTLKQAHTISGINSYIGYAALSPELTRTAGTSNPTTMKQLLTLENQLFLHFSTDTHPTTKKIITQPPNTPLLQHITFKLPNTNHHNEHITHIISGLSPSLIHNDVATLRELGAEIFRALFHAYCNKSSSPTKLPPVLNRHTSRFHINQLTSVKYWNIPTNKKSNNNPERLLAISIAKETDPGKELISLFNNLCDNEETITICGRIDISIIPIEILNNMDNPTLRSTIKAIKAANNNNYHRTQVRLFKDLPIHANAIKKPTYLQQIINTHLLCRAIFLNLQFVMEHTLNLNDTTRTGILRFLATGCAEIDILPSTRRLNLLATEETTTSTPPTSPQKPRSTHSSNNSTTSKYVAYTLPSTVVTSPNSLKYHVLINPAGGIAMAGIYKGHFDINNLRSLSEHISYPYNRSYQHEHEAWAYWETFYPEYTTYAHILFMNYNAPVESTNLNNPSKRLQDLIGNTKSTNIPKEKSYFKPDSMDPIMILSRRAASERMHKLGLNPIDSFDFLPTDHPRIFNSVTDLPLDPSTIPITHHPNKTTDTVNLMDFIQDITTSNTNEDEVSLISHQTESILHIDQHTGTNKRARTTSTRSINTENHHTALAKLTPTNIPAVPFTPQPRFIGFTTPTTTSQEDILTTILHNNTNNIITPHSIAQHIAFAPLLGLPHIKLAYIKILQTDQIDNIANYLLPLFPNGNPREITSLPPLLTSTPTIDPTPSKSMPFPTNCRVIQCPYYNNGFEETIPPDEVETKIQHLHEHGIGIHYNLYTHTSEETLSTIGWYKCCPTCDSIFFGTHLLSTHRNTCNNYSTFNKPQAIPQTTTTQQQTQPQQHQPLDISNEMTKQFLFSICPPNHHTELHTMLNNNTPIANINSTIFSWIATNSADDLNCMNSINTNDL